ncbi:LAFE_0B03620g1_1 [Lachancea fermentati]|uniref:LAFE_0B03620g1_1 n=1 Tax=Lachancea fermentati TaxID=4955 RepID=A0A1G4M7T8_LACFM|nr:LAFE_0B03620g1_1 [Lachancea fermentati]
MCLPKFTEFLDSSIDEQTKVLGTLFEHSDSLIWFTLKNKSFMTRHWAGYISFIESIRQRLLELCDDTEREGISSRGVDHLANIIAAHPKLGEPKQQLSLHSLDEQKNLTNDDTPEVQQALSALNREYENIYEGLRFVVFVNGRSRPEIIDVMKRRINSGNTWYDEARLAIREMCDIAEDRARKYAPECQIHRM